MVAPLSRVFPRHAKADLFGLFIGRLVPIPVMAAVLPPPPLPLSLTGIPILRKPSYPTVFFFLSSQPYLFFGPCLAFDPPSFDSGQCRVF